MPWHGQPGQKAAGPEHGCKVKTDSDEKNRKEQVLTFSSGRSGFTFVLFEGK